MERLINQCTRGKPFTENFMRFLKYLKIHKISWIIFDLKFLKIIFQNELELKFMAFFSVVRPSCIHNFF